MYPDTQLFLAGQLRPGGDKATAPVYNPATGEQIGRFAVATTGDLDEAVAAAERAFPAWRAMGPLKRSAILRKAADLVRERAAAMAPVMTMEQGKPLAESEREVTNSGDVLEWFAEEGRRAYGRLIPARDPNVMQLVTREPIGIVAAFSPWNFPVSQAARKIAAALAAGCPIILKGPEDTPASCALFVQCLADAGVPAGILSLVYGDPATISDHLIAHPSVRKVSFTGSTAVGKLLAAKAGAQMKRCTMELGGHAPAIVCDDADLEGAVKTLAMAKFRNAGQICIAPTRFLVQDKVYDTVLGRFEQAAKAVKVGDGLAAGTTMGPLAHGRRIEAMEGFLADAAQKGGEIRLGGKRHGNTGHFFEPTIIEGLGSDARLMNEEPFGPIALFSRFSEIEEAVAEANRLSYGLAAYAFTRSSAKAHKLSQSIESGMVSINHHGMSLPEVPHGGIKDSGYGSEGGAEALEGYMTFKYVTQMMV
ncbi:NAD-dependent succinate-semialdehyde dehydrogenase [Bosea sp. BK604]|uniref:NAD-dependent succinate-semialdehyde dehydrogenase n=1 Tax=Bosea sp. BK604 TaxID=2512180 RepID=UPI001042F558|nr:NAD-dependent succinate-semialdehyde dehydrogenase [Bosea sp. BK604]TCR70643.1 succinate-semialdehyde dehydrogenase/glutarate-semialdehyde dehydrogenase [Bosea sp. BK604]